jgi:hypothetical protein
MLIQCVAFGGLLSYSRSNLAAMMARRICNHND